MSLSVIDLYRDVLPKTTCQKCGFKTCLAFAIMVISERLFLEKLPYLSPEILAACKTESQAQYAAGKWIKKDMAQNALEWAKQRSASMNISDMPKRIGGRLVDRDGKLVLELPILILRS
jgi:ArsR family metal-binding transcriptional regulator